MRRQMPLAVLALSLFAAPAAATAADLPRSLDGVALGMSLDEARAAAISAGRAFAGCDTLRGRADGSPIVTICSHRGEGRGTEVAVGDIDLQVWADGAERVFAVVRAEPLSCVPEDQVGAVRHIKSEYGPVTQWVPPWSWRGSAGGVDLLVDVINGSVPCGVTYEVRDTAAHAAVAEALQAEME